jgi:hypothetical protein
MLQLTVLLSVLSSTLIAVESDPWWKWRDDRLGVVEDIHSKVLQKYTLDGGITLGFNRCEDASYDFVVPNGTTLDWADMLKRFKECLSFGGSPWEPLPTADVAGVFPVDQGTLVASQSFTWRSIAIEKQGVIDRSLYITLSLHQKQRIHLSIVRMRLFSGDNGGAWNRFHGLDTK